MTCYKAKYSGTLKANSEIDELKWLNHKDLDIISEVDKDILLLMKGRAEIKKFRRLFPAFFSLKQCDYNQIIFHYNKIRHSYFIPLSH
jgi:hypothetical protein